MFRRLSLLLCLLAPPALAETPDLAAIVDQHVLPGYRSLAEQGAALDIAAQTDCDANNAALHKAFHTAFDAWTRVSHLRFGPSETGDRAFALAFWPDSRGATPKVLARLLGASDPVIETPAGMASLSVAGRGFYALEFLLFDPTILAMGTPAYRCALIRATTTDIARNSAAILADWENSYANALRAPGPNGVYRTPEEAARQFLTALGTGLEFAAATRLGRPMGSFDKPRPKRAEARRSGRSLRHVILSLEALRGLAALLSSHDPALDRLFDKALDRAMTLNDPVFAGVATPQGRLAAEVLQQAIQNIGAHVAQDLGPRLGVAAGFNSLDGD